MTETTPFCRQCGKNPVVLQDLVCHECAQTIQARIQEEIARQRGPFSVQWTSGTLALRLRCFRRHFLFYFFSFRAK
jgi:hypothetical protein